MEPTAPPARDATSDVAALPPPAGMPARRGDGERWLLRHSERIAFGLALLVAGALAVIGVTLHPIELFGTESDGYVRHAEQLLAGEWPTDPFRPLLYALLTAGVGSLTGDCFLAGKLVSAAAGGALVFVVHRLGRRVFDRGTGLLAAVLVAVHPEVIEHSVLAATDGLFTLTFTLAVVAIVRAAQRPGSGPAVRAGLCFALAWFTRYAATALLPVLVLAVLVGARPGTRWRRLAVCAAAIVVALVPHMVISSLRFGAPFHDENWRTLAMRHFGDGSWAYLRDNPFDGMWSVLRHDPARIAANLVESLGRFASGLPRLLATGTQGAVPTLLTALLVVGVVFGWQRRARAASHLVLALAAYVMLIAATFYMLPRVLVAVVPGSFVLLAWSTLRVFSLGSGRAHRPFRRWARVLGAVLAVLAVGASTPAALRVLADSHPLLEVAAARELARTAGRDVDVLSSYGALDHYAPCRTRWIDVRATPATAFGHVTDVLLESHAEYVLTGRQSTPAASWSALVAATVPKCLEVVHADPNLRVWRVRRLAIDAALTGALAIEHAADGACVVSCTPRPDLPARTRFRLTVGGAGGHRVVELQPGAGGVRSATFRSLPPGARFVLRAMTPDGQLYASAPVASVSHSPAPAPSGR